MSKEKKKLLINWGNSYIFYEVMLPLMSRLAEKFSVYLILNGAFFPDKLGDELMKLKNEGKLSSYWILPDHRQMVEHHSFIKRHLGPWRDIRFDLFLTISGIEVIDRYLLECALPEHCRRLTFWTALGYLMQNENLTASLLKDQQPAARAGASSFRSKLKGKGYSLNTLKWLLGCIYARIKGLKQKHLKRLRYHYLDRIILPWIMAGKIFTLNQKEEFARITSSRIDAMIFCDELEGKAFGVFYQGTKTYVAQYPTQGLCRCSQNNVEKTTLLVPLTTGITGADQLPDELLSVIYRDLKTVMDRMGAKKVELRLHPRESAHWPQHLEKYLIGKGMVAKCVAGREAIRDIICDYIGIAGFASTSLKDARAACDNAVVIGFAAVSQKFTNNPKLWFGRSEGIGWIEADGSYDPLIFKREKYLPPTRKTLDEILVELS